MSRHHADTAAMALLHMPNFIDTGFAAPDRHGRSSMVASIERLAAADPILMHAEWTKLRGSLCASLGLPGSTQNDKPFAFSNGVAVIPIYGMLINRFASCWGFVTGYNFIISQLNAACDDDEVNMIAFDVNSPGGQSAGCAEASLAIFQSRAIKPSVAIIDSMCYSAAYYIASAATSMFATPSSGVGSIGVYQVREDITGMLAQMGVKLDVIFAGANKLDTNPFTPFSDAAKDRMQASVDQIYDMFCADVARNRTDLDVEAVKATKASCYSAADAVTAKLIDGVATPQSALEQAGAAKDTDPDNEPDDDQEDDIEMAATQEEINAAVAADRARAASIVNCAEAAGKGRLAAVLANTGMSLAEAQTALAAAAPEVPPASSNPLENAMAVQGTPGVQTNTAANPGGEQKADRSLELLASHDAARGTTYAQDYKDGVHLKGRPVAGAGQRLN